MPLSSLNFPFLCASPALGSAHPAGLGVLVPFGGPCPSTLWPIRADLLQCRPLSLYPSADKRLGPVGLLIALPSGRFGPISCHFGPCPSTLWPFRQFFAVGGPCPSTVKPFQQLFAVTHTPFVSAPPPSPCRSTLWPIWTNMRRPLASGCVEQTS